VDELTLEFIAESQEGLERMELCLTELERRPGDSELVSEIFRTVHTIKGATGFLGFARLQALAHTGEGLLGALRDGKIAVTAELITGLLRLLDGLRAILRLIETAGTEGLRSTDDDRELIALLTRLKAVGGVTAAAGEPAPRDARHTELSSDLPGKDRTLRIDVEVLNRMMNLVGELVLTRNQIVQSSPGAEAFPELARRLNNVTAELREQVRQARMQPVGHLFGKFPRMVRDLAIECGRQVRIEFEGQETRLDKSLLEAIRDPLTHAVRNSVDHGIEPPERRMLAGKPTEGVVLLRAFHQSGSVVVEVIDDGAGISTERVLAKAVERGLVTPEKAASMTDREALRLIFVPGFSTANEVTNVSGRGVGLDVVRANVEKVGGSVEVESRAGAGTTVRLRVPLTLAIVPALVVRCGEHSFALPQNALSELVYVARRDAESAVQRIGAAAVYQLRESLLPLVSLDRLLGLEPSTNAGPRDFYIAVLESEGLRFGLVVDRLMAPEEIVVKPLSAVLRELGVFSGATMLGNGNLALILDVVALGQRAGVQPADLASAAAISENGPVSRQDAQAERAQIETSMVVYEAGKRGFGKTGPGVRMAMPLSAVERIERVPLSQIEYAGGRAVLQFGGEWLPLEDEDQVLAKFEQATAIATILICRRPGTHATQRVGIVVRRVLDVSPGVLLPADTAQSADRLAMVKGRVTTLFSEFAGQTVMMEEVA
jgi:two-component system chemotaxis sensor kinase CheA